MITEQGLHNFFIHMRQADQRYRYARPLDARKLFARQVEQSVAVRLIKGGYTVRPTPNNARCDLIVNDALRVEVKAAAWTPAQNGVGRYQAHIHNKADLFIFTCANGRYHHFVIPASEIGPRTHIAVWSYVPKDYTGWMAPFLEAWPLVAVTLEKARQNVYQLSFNLEG